MSHLRRYRPYRPMLYRRPMHIFWWMRKRAHVRFIVRELTSVFVMLYAVVLVCLVRALAEGPEAYAAFLAWHRSPFVVALHVVGFVMVLFHSITWFGLAPKALVLHVGGRRVPARAITGANYAAWAVVSAVLAGLLLT